jgi:hypothetical protein
MKSTNTTRLVAKWALGLFGLYALFGIGMTGLLFSIAVGLIVFGFMDSIELATAIVIISGLLYKYFTSPSIPAYVKKEQPGRSTEGFTDGADTIVKRVNAIKQPVGVYSSSFTEGFADAGSATSGQAQGKQSTEDVGTTESAPEEAKKDDKKEAFTESTGAEGLFKLGEIPTESKSGPHIDQGTTLMTAIGSMKPEQIQAMTADTRKLLDTQKSLMSMLHTMKPMLNDGKQLMETFQQMFGKDGMPTSA